MSLFNDFTDRLEEMFGEELENIDPAQWEPRAVDLSECKSNFEVTGKLNEDLKKLYGLRRKYKKKASNLAIDEGYKIKMKNKLLQLWFLFELFEQVFNGDQRRDIYIADNFRVVVLDSSENYYRCPGLVVVDPCWVERS